MPSFMPYIVRSRRILVLILNAPILIVISIISSSADMKA